MPDVPLISVLLPNHNHAQFLPNALDAIRTQTWRNIEVVVIDDASTDHSRDIVRSVCERDPRVRLIALPARHGVNGALREGLRAVSGGYLCMAAADDFIAPTFLEKSVTVLLTAPGAAFCFSDPAELLDETGERRDFPLRLAPAPTAFDADAFVDLLASNYFHISSQTILFRRAFFVETGGYRDELEWMADWFLNHVAAFRHGVCYLPETLGYLRLRADSIWAVARRDAKARQRVFRRIVRLLAEPAYADVRDKFRRAALLPEYHFSTLVWLVSVPEGRALVTPRLIWRVLSRGSWFYLRPFSPLWLRQKARQWARGARRRSNAES